MTARQPKMKSDPKLAPEEIPEVANFVAADQELAEYVEEVRHEYPNVLERLEQLSEHRNAALEAANMAVRAVGVACGPFEVHRQYMAYDAAALFDNVGEARFLELGGSIETKRVLSLDGARFEAAVAFKKVEGALILAVRKEKVDFKQLKKVWTS